VQWHGKGQGDGRAGETRQTTEKLEDRHVGNTGACLGALFADRLLNRRKDCDELGTVLERTERLRVWLHCDGSPATAHVSRKRTCAAYTLQPWLHPGLVRLMSSRQFAIAVEELSSLLRRVDINPSQTMK